MSREILRYFPRKEVLYMINIINAKSVTAIIMVLSLIGILVASNADAEENNFSAGEPNESVCISGHTENGESIYYCETFDSEGVLVSMNANCAGRCTGIYQIAIVDLYGPDALSVSNVPSNALLLPPVSSDPDGVRARLTAYMPTHVAIVGGPSAVSNDDMRAAFFAVYYATSSDHPLVFDRFYGDTRVGTMLSTFDANLSQMGGGVSGK